MSKVDCNNPLHRHVFQFNPECNGDESLILTTKFTPNGDPVEKEGSLTVDQELSLYSYCNSATFNLCGASLTSNNLRKLANELESAEIQAKEKLRILQVELKKSENDVHP